MTQKLPPLTLVSICVSHDAFPIVQSTLERERSGFTRKIYRILKLSLPRLQWVSCSLSQSQGWESLYPVPKGSGDAVVPNFTNHCIEIGLVGVSPNSAARTIETMREEGAPLGHRVLSLAGISDSSMYLATDISSLSRTESVIYTPRI